MSVQGKPGGSSRPAVLAEGRSYRPRVVVDTRPLWLVLLSRSHRAIIFSLLALLFWAIISVPTPTGLRAEGQAAIAVFAVCLVLWVTQVLPLMITSILAILLLAVLQVVEKTEAYSLFGNEAVFFILGAFILSGSMMKCGLSSRLAMITFERFGSSPRRLLLGILLSSAFMSFWMPAHAVAAMMFPIVLTIVRALDLKPMQSAYGKAVFVSLAWGCVIGGVATLLGGARNPLANAILLETTKSPTSAGLTIGFFEWIVTVLPMVAVMLAVSYAMLVSFFRIDIDSVAGAEGTLREEIKALGKVTTSEKMIGSVMFLTILCWVFFGTTLGLANIALGSVVVLFMLRLVRWRDVEQYVNWGIILMYGGAISLGYALESSGAALWTAELTVSKIVSTPIMAIVIFSFVSIFLTEGISNSAVVAVLTPIALSVTGKYGIDPKVMVYSVAVPAGLAFCMPMGTPPNAIAFSSGFLRIRDVLWPGLILKIGCWLIFLIGAKFYWSVLGLAI